MKYFKVFLDAFKYTHIYQSQTNDYPFLDEAQEVMDNLGKKEIELVLSSTTFSWRPPIPTQV